LTSIASSEPDLWRRIELKRAELVAEVDIYLANGENYLVMLKLSRELDNLINEYYAANPKSQRVKAKFWAAL